MCDDLTQDDADKAVAARGLSRRDFAMLGVATAAVAIGGGAQAAAPGPHMTLIRHAVQIRTPDGMADALFYRPEEGVVPGIVMWPDIAGSRLTFTALAMDLAAKGYAVLLVNQYYRSAPAPVLQAFSQWQTPEGQAKLKPMIAAITPAGTRGDAAAFVAFLDGEAAVDKTRRIGTCGYCMGGPFAVRTAAAVPARVGAVASLHGAKLAGDEPDSPVKLIGATQASYLFAIGRGDDAREPDTKDKLKAAATAAHRPAEIEVYHAEHGWCVPDSPVYDAVEANRAWDRMLALFATL